ncbi:MAG: hypothetical protein IKX78_01055, partial [Clostridia bacterium]|nr:hypothetical protein [Clostridia bacterium]
MKRVFLAFVFAVCFLLIACSAEKETVPDYVYISEIDMENVREIYPDLSDVPAVYIEIDRDLFAVNRENYVNATVTVPDSGVIEADASIKG